MIIRSKLTPGLLKSIKQGDINLKELLKYLDYWESEHLNKDLYAYLKRKYGDRGRINRIKYIV